MVKKPTTLTIDHEVIEKAKTMGINLSATAERAIRERSGIKEVEINTTIEECEFCNYKDRKLTWLWPDERWICNKCLYLKSTPFSG